MYQNSNLDKLFVGLKKHLLISQNTSVSKSERIKSLNNISEVLEYLVNTDEASDNIILTRFFNHLLIKVKKSIIQIHQEPLKFNEEIGFLTTLLEITKH